MRLLNYTKRTFSCVLTCVLCLTLVPPPPARAGVLGGFATEWTQIANNVQLITTYIRQGEQLRQEIMMVLDMTKQGNVLPSQVFGTVMADLARLHSSFKMAVHWRTRWETWMRSFATDSAVTGTPAIIGT